MRFLYLALSLAAEAVSMGEVRRVELPAEAAGATSAGADRVLVWGDGIWEVAGGAVRKLADGRFGPGGCLATAGGSTELVLLRLPDRLVLRSGAGLGLETVLDTGSDMTSCLEATLLGRRGVLVTHLGMQVRFYSQAGGKWSYREIYSFYTASYQSGLRLADVDGDGRPDIFCGNYWIRSPERFELPWRLFAINTYNERPESAKMQLDYGAGTLLVSQGALDGGRVTEFGKPADPRQLWEERGLGEYRRPIAIRVGRRVVVGEGVPDGRLLVVAPERRTLDQGREIRGIWAEGDGVVALSPRSVSWHTFEPIE